MCMISYFGAGIPVDDTAVWNGSTWNSDGHGWAVAAETGRMILGKHMSAELAIDAFLDARSKYPDAPAMFHSRLATHGSVNEYNVHPFKVGPHAVVSHNGILPSAFWPKGKDARSDTHIMADQWLARQSRFGTWSHNERAIIGDLIGKGNKLCILSVSPKLSKPRGFLVNGMQGEWQKDGAWYSNNDFQYEWTRKTYSGLWSHDDDGYVIGNRPKGAYHSFNDGECPFCFGKDTVDYISQVCTFCHMCIDCGEYITECLCYTPIAAIEAAKAKADAEADDDANTPPWASAYPDDTSMRD
jgi:predicted glutamine amidotransferase